jgi:hypothetical protein
MSWEVLFHPKFDAEYEKLNRNVQDELLAHAELLQRIGPSLGRPSVDTLNGSRHANMKELRFNADGGVWRIAFAFDPDRHAILLVGGNKLGADKKKFYRELIKEADTRFDECLAIVQQERQHAQSKKRKGK